MSIPIQDDAVIRPKKPGSWPDSPKIALMIGSPPDLNQAISLGGMTRKHGRTFLNSRLYLDTERTDPLCIVGPFIGAPYAVILLETLIAWGVQQVIFFGWCGSLTADIGVGEVFVPTAALVSDGTSPHYTSGERAGETRPSDNLNAVLLSECGTSGLQYHKGPIWTTDAVFRETPELIGSYQEKGALAVEMEAAALFAAARFRGIDISAIMAVSDELHTMSWAPGFSSTRFRKVRKDIAELIFRVTDKLQGERHGSEC